MVKQIIKRDGSKEDFDWHKVLKWGEWASEHLEDYVDWPPIVTEAVSLLPEVCTSQELQEKLIDTCLSYSSWSYYMMAGRLYGAYLHKLIYGDNRPTIKQLHERLHEVGLMVKLDYTEEEYAEAESYIDHDKDLNTPHFALHQIRSKYALQNRVEQIEYETPQFTYMRMAMALAEDEPVERRMLDVQKWYEHLSNNRINAPSPNYVNLGTPLNGYASCVVYTTRDEAPSLAVGDHIAYMMTVMSAGIGNNINTRSIYDPVRGGIISHQGRLPYYRALVGAVKANLQNGRGGAATTYYSVFDPEADVIVRLKNQRSTDSKKIRGIDYAMLQNKFVARKVARKEQIFTFNSFTAPDLWDAFYSDDEALFTEIYTRYENDPLFKKNYVPARDLVLQAMIEAYETGRHYMGWIDEINHHTPFMESIYSSNLCVAPESTILTSKGEIVIGNHEGESVEIWNGEDWSTVRIVKTGTNQKLVTVKLEDGRGLTCTPYHKWYIVAEDKSYKEVRTHELQAGDLIIPTNLPFNETVPVTRVAEVIDEGRVDDTYCVREPKRHMAVFNGILTGQCVEIALPTKGYHNMQDLFSTEDHGRGEVATCSLGGIVLPNIESDEQYEEVMYYTLLMIDKCIHKSEYVLPHVGVTAKSRLSAGIGIMGLAHEVARRGLKYTTAEGKRFFHEVAERHYYYALKASLRLGKERGNAPWMHKTKWPQGWLPLDTYNRNVDGVVDSTLNYDWESLRQQIIENKGIRNSVLVAYMPGEASSKASATSNSIYPVRELEILKSDNNIVTRWAAPESERLAENYELAWDIPSKDMVDMYAIFQKFTDQAISADFYRSIQKGEMVSSTEMIQDYLYMTKMGMKTRYYQVSDTSDGNDVGVSEDTVTGDLKPNVDETPQVTPSQGVVESVTIHAVNDGVSFTSIQERMSEEDDEAGCASGACTL